MMVHRQLSPSSHLMQGIVHSRSRCLTTTLDALTGTQPLHTNRNSQIEFNWYHFDHCHWNIIYLDDGPDKLPLIMLSKEGIAQSCGRVMSMTYHGWYDAPRQEAAGACPRGTPALVLPISNECTSGDDFKINLDERVSFFFLQPPILAKTPLPCRR